LTSAINFTIGTMPQWLYRTRAQAETPIPATSVAMELARSEFPFT
jgi:hypothetical protein